MKKVKSKAISASSVRKLLEETQHFLDQNLSERAHIPVYSLAGGSALLVFEDGRGRLYESRETLDTMISEGEKLAKKPPINPLRALLKSSRNFAEEVPELLRELPARLGIDAGELNGSEASLERVDEAIRRIGRARVLSPEIFRPLTAYVGEVIRDTAGGRWDMRRGSDGDTWEPWIVDAEGRSYAPFGIFKDIYEHGRSASLRGFVNGQIRSYRLGG